MRNVVGAEFQPYRFSSGYVGLQPATDQGIRLPASTEGPTSIAVSSTAWSFADDVAIDSAFEIAVELPIDIRYGSVPHAVMMGTPADLRDFAIGFSLAEGIITGNDDIRRVDIQVDPGKVTIDIDLAPQAFSRQLARKRTLSGRSSCGVCGIEDASQLPYARQAARPAEAPIEARAIAAAIAGLGDWQPLHAQTRCMHGAAWCDLSGQIMVAREDIGRHNALDKLVGAVLQADLDPSRGFVLVTSRSSFEMVEKAAALGAHTLASMSAPTSLAIDRAKTLGLTLVTTARSNSCIVHTGQLSRSLSIDGRAKANSSCRANSNSR